MHYFYATNTPLVTIITTGVLVEVPGLKPGLVKSKFTVLPLHYTSLVPVARLELARLPTLGSRPSVFSISPHRHGAVCR